MGNYFWSFTDNACENGGAVPQSMDEGMMERVIHTFKDAARRAVLADFDMIELQLGHDLWKKSWRKRCLCM